MNIIVCVKQVPGTPHVKINPETGTQVRDGVESVLNPFDEYAIEEGLRIREQAGGTLKAISMGPPQAAEALRVAIAMGADEGYLVSDPAFAGSDTWATAYALSAAIKSLGRFDLIVCGKQASDGDTAQVGPGVAEMLDIPFVAWVRKVEEVTHTSVRVQRLMEDGYDILAMPTPCLITVVKEINTPRLPTIKGKIKSKNAPITILTPTSINCDVMKCGQKGSATQGVRSFVPQRKNGGGKVTGENPILVAKLKETLMVLGAAN